MNQRAALEGLAHGLELALTSIRELVSEADRDAWVDQVTSPLGRRRHCELARRGLLAGARKDRGRWYVRRREIDAYLESRAAQQEPDGGGAEEAAILAFRAKPRGGKRPRR
jgi:hypothetical protein